LDFDVAAHPPAQPSADRKSEPSAAVLARRRAVGLAALLEQPSPLLGRHAVSVIGNTDDQPFVIALPFSRRVQRDRALLGELAGIAEEIEKDLAHPQRID